MSQIPHIYLVEDNLELAELIKSFLINNGMQVSVLNDGTMAVEKITQAQPDLVILDRMLPGVDGLTICRQLKPHYQGHIIMLTAMTLEEEQITGLSTGADDYICKPVSPRLLLARIENQLKRQKNPQKQKNQLKLQQLELNNELKLLKVSGKSVELTGAEFDTLWLLANNEGKALTRDQLSLVIRGQEHDGKARSIDLYISKLRNKINLDNQPYIITTVRSVGYKMVINNHE